MTGSVWNGDVKALRAILSGCTGRLGEAISRQTLESGTVKIVGGVCRSDCTLDFPVYRTFDSELPSADVIIDASHPLVTGDLIEFALERSVPIVICTTGHTDYEEYLISRASGSIPILKSRNMSLGVNLLLELVRRCAAVLGDEYDAEIVEAHHSKKLDSPSGTALMLADAIKETRGEGEYIYDRHEMRAERGKSEIGIHSVRAGGYIGEHRVIFAGRNEVIELSHSAGNRELFAAGALRAALFVASAPPGYYTMSDVISKDIG